MPLKYTQNEHYTGLMFLELTKGRVSYDSYTMVYHMDISNYETITPYVEKCIESINKLCTIKMVDDCNIILKQLEEHLVYMKQDEADINAYQQFSQEGRQRRAIEFIGKFYHWAFGLMDADTARKYDEKINELQRESSRLHSIQQEQISFIKEDIHANNYSYHMLQEKIDALDKKVSEVYFNLSEALSETLIEIQTKDEIIELVQIIQSMIMQHRRLSELILRSVENAVNGKINQLVPLKKLSDDLSTIEKELPEYQKLPVNLKFENPLHTFKHSTVTASLFDKRLLIEITIPILEREIYTIYKIIPIPAVINNSVNVIILPSTDYFLLNDIGSEYIPITETEFSTSVFNIASEKIIKPAENVHLDYHESCELNIFMNPNENVISRLCNMKVIPRANYFTPIDVSNTFYVTISSPITVFEHCRNKTVQTHYLNASGILELEKFCRINTEKISLRPRTNIRFLSNGIVSLNEKTHAITINAFLDKMKKINVSIPALTMKDQAILIHDPKLDFNYLNEKANQLIKDTEYEVKFKEIHYDNENTFTNSLITATTISVILNILFIVGLSFCLYRKFYNPITWTKVAKVLSKNETLPLPKLFTQNVYPKSPHPKRKQEEDIELKDIEVK